MRQIAPQRLWIGHAGDLRNMRAVLELGVTAILDLADSEPPASPPRDIVYCRFPLLDGADKSALAAQCGAHDGGQAPRARRADSDRVQRGNEPLSCPCCR